MPDLPDIPGKGLVTETTKQARVLVLAASTAAITVGGFVLKRVLGHGGDQRVDADPIAETPTAPPGAEAKPVPKVAPAAPAGPASPKPESPRPTTAKAPPKKPAGAPAPPKPKPGKATADKPKPAKPKAKKPTGSAKPKAKAKPKPPAPTGTDAPAKPSAEPGNISVDREHPHRALNNPVSDPDETEYPDPFEKRPDPRDPVDPDGEPFGEEPHPATGSESTSEPPLSQDPEVVDGGKPPKREKLDD